MKQLLLLSFFLFLGMQLMAVKPIEAPATQKQAQKSESTVMVTHSAEKKGGGILAKLFKKNKVLKKMTDWVKAKVLKKAIDLDDPVMKWLWFAIILAIVGIVVGIFSSFVPFLWIVSSLVGLAATICFIYWLILFLEANS